MENPVVTACRVGGQNSVQAAKLAAELRLESVFEGGVPPDGVILIDDPKAFAAAGADVAAAVRAGLRAVGERDDAIPCELEEGRSMEGVFKGPEAVSSTA